MIWRSVFKKNPDAQVKLLFKNCGSFIGFLLAIWQKICDIQGKDPDTADDDGEVDDQQSDSSNSNGSGGISSTLSLPPCTGDQIAEIDKLIADSMNTPTSREKMANALQQQKYVIIKICLYDRKSFIQIYSYLARLIDVFHSWEEAKHKELEHFHSIAKNMFLLNTNLMLNELLNEKYFKYVFLSHSSKTLRVFCAF